MYIVCILPHHLNNARHFWLFAMARVVRTRVKNILAAAVVCGFLQLSWVFVTAWHLGRMSMREIRSAKAVYQRANSGPNDETMQSQNLWHFHRCCPDYWWLPLTSFVAFMPWNYIQVLVFWLLRSPELSYGPDGPARDQGRQRCSATCIWKGVPLWTDDLV